jgi:23S rRNA maturation-related 3'-5' exoribonuclease YhaM
VTSLVEVDAGKLAALRDGVRKSLPELSLIGDIDLREKCIDAWALALSQTEFQTIEDIPPTGTPTSPYLKSPLTQADHMRGTATIAIGMIDGLEQVAGKTRIDRDLVIASALLHDVGKAWEVSPRNLKRWRADPALTGSPSFRHSAYGGHICLTVGLPETVAHTAAYHSGGGEGEWIQRSMENTIVYLADLAFWKMSERAGLLEEEMFDPDRTLFRLGIRTRTGHPTD